MRIPKWYPNVHAYVHAHRELFPQPKFSFRLTGYLNSSISRFYNPIPTRRDQESHMLWLIRFTWLGAWFWCDSNANYLQHESHAILFSLQGGHHSCCICILWRHRHEVFRRNHASQPPPLSILRAFHLAETVMKNYRCRITAPCGIITIELELYRSWPWTWVRHAQIDVLRVSEMYWIRNESGSDGLGEWLSSLPQAMKYSEHSVSRNCVWTAGHRFLGRDKDVPQKLGVHASSSLFFRNRKNAWNEQF